MNPRQTANQALSSTFSGQSSIFTDKINGIDVISSINTYRNIKVIDQWTKGDVTSGKELVLETDPAGNVTIKFIRNYIGGIVKSKIEQLKITPENVADFLTYIMSNYGGLTRLDRNLTTNRNKLDSSYTDGISKNAMEVGAIVEQKTILIERKDVYKDSLWEYCYVVTRLDENLHIITGVEEIRYNNQVVFVHNINSMTVIES